MRKKHFSLVKIKVKKARSGVAFLYIYHHHAQWRMAPGRARRARAAG
jgi:hypothetical protein